MMTPEQLVDLAVEALEDIKGEDIRVIDVRGTTTITDYMIIVSGSSDRKVKALANSVSVKAKENGITPIGMEGQQQGEWVLVDLNDVIVHAMQRETRLFYQLEKLWGSTEAESDESEVSGS